MSPLITIHILRQRSLPVAVGVLLALASISTAQVAELNVGDAAPPITLDELVQAPNDASADLESLRGQVVMLEFWATWCAPCLKAMPHVNDLHRQFAERGVQVIAITREEPALVKRFLKDGAIEPWVGIDADATTSRAYGITAIPTTVLIDRQGRVAAITSPDKVTPETLSALVAGKPIDLPVQKIVPFSLSWDEPGSGDLTEPITQVILKESQASSGRMWGIADGRLIADGMQPKSFIETAYDVPSYQVDWRVPDDGTRYRISVVVPHADDQLARDMMKLVVERTLGLHTRWETREVETAIFRRVEGDAPGLVASDAEETDGFFASTRAAYTGATLDDFVYLSRAIVLKMPAVNETGLDGRYDFEFEWERGNRDSFLEAIAAFGLRVEFQTRPLEILIVEPMDAPE